MKDKIVIELRGVEFINKGAELMLHAIMQYVQEQVPNAVFAMDNVLQLSPRRKHLEYGIYTKIGFQLKRYQKFRIFSDFSGFTALFSKDWRDRHYFVKDQDVDVVLDGSGFALGDQWGPEYAGRVLADHIRKWKDQGKKVILLPQAFGPFTNSRLQAKMKVIGDNADLIFARDPISYDYLTSILSNNKKISLYPDFTNLIKGYVPSYFNSDLEVAIIPNFKMISATSADDGKAYVEMLKNIIQTTIDKGYKPYFLIHEGDKDAKLAHKINQESFESTLPIIVDDNPLAVKGMIGASKAVITARFHGLVSALSQGVPCLATGWSHKYEMLLADYKFPSALLDVNLSQDELKKKVDMVLDENSSESIKRSLNEQSLDLKEKSKEMWSHVINLLKS